MAAERGLLHPSEGPGKTQSEEMDGGVARRSGSRGGRTHIYGAYIRSPEYGGPKQESNVMKFVLWGGGWTGSIRAEMENHGGCR